MLRLSFSSSLDWSFYIASIAKNAYKKIGALINMKFLSLEVAFCVYKSTIRSCMENFMSVVVLEYVG